MKRLKFWRSLFIFLIVGLSGYSSSDAARLEKIEKAYSVNCQAILLVTLNIDAGELKVHQNEQPDQILVSIQYDTRSDEVELEFDEKKNELYLSIDRVEWLKSYDDDGDPRLEVSLPFEVEIDFRSKVKAGEIKFDLGALKLKDFQLRNFAGEVEVDFSKPNPIEMELLDVNVKVGETTLRRLGNARFHSAKINGGIGELSIDFAGEGLTSARAEIDLDVGETTIYLPRDLGVRFDSSTFGFLTQISIDDAFIKKGRFHYNEKYESAPKTMDFSISSGIGELRVIYR